MEWKITTEMKPKDGLKSRLAESGIARTERAAVVQRRPNRQAVLNSFTRSII
jgi:hypothetical protein